MLSHRTTQIIANALGDHSAAKELLEVLASGVTQVAAAVDQPAIPPPAAPSAPPTPPVSVVPSSIVATSGTLPPATPAITFASGQTPKGAELLAAVVSLSDRLNAVIEALKTHGIVTSS
jgi:uncharacterized membrane protein